jgi:uncharacterized membrane protein
MKRAYPVILGICLLVLILSGALHIVVLNPILYSAFSGPQARSVAGYLHHGESMGLELTQRERLHMQDVQHIIQCMDRTLGAYALFAAVLLFFAFLKNRLQKKTIHRILLVASIGSGAVAGMILLSLLLFQPAFLLMHKLLFRNDLWLLPAQSTLLEVFPTSFFIKIGIALLLYMVIISAVSLATAVCVGHEAHIGKGRKGRTARL